MVPLGVGGWVYPLGESVCAACAGSHPMRHPGPLLAVIGLLLGGLTASAAVELKIGDPAPPFSLPGTDGRTYRLADHKDKQVVVLAWFAKAFTGG